MENFPRTQVRDDDPYSYFNPAISVWVVWDREKEQEVDSYSSQWAAIQRWQELMGIRVQGK